jgi:Ricin-type beta-trefoil lectin domain-like
MYSHDAQCPKKYSTLRKRILHVLVAATVSVAACSTWAQTTATVTVNASSVSAAVPPEGYGLNTYVWDDNMFSSGVAAQIQASGVNSLRYPGGSDSDLFTFISGTDQTMSSGYMWANDTFNNFMSSLAIPEGGKPIITINYGSNGSFTGPAPTSEAAAWVQYANVTNNYGIVYWEIGNETYGNGYYAGWDWETDLHDTDQTAADRIGNAALSPTAYGTNAAAFVKAMKAVDPNIKCGISINTSSYAANWDQDVFQAISSALNGTGYYPDFVIVHWYPGGTAAQILATQAGIPAQVAQIRTELNSYYTLSNKSAIQILVTETGPASEGGVFPFLFTADDYLTWFENGASNVDFEDEHQGYLASPGDTGNTSNSYLNPYGPWYGVSLSSTVARAGDNMVSATSSNSLLRVHAVNRTDGKVGVILLNEDPNNSTSVNVSVSNAALSSSGTQYTFGNSNFSSGSYTANSGISSNSISGVGNNFSVTVPAYSATAIVIPTSGCTPTTITPYLQVNAGAWQEVATTTVASGSTVSLGPQPASGGSWKWAGPGGYTSTSREIDGIPLSSGTNSYVATYTNASGCQSTETFTITVSGSSALIPNGTYIVTSVHSGLALGDPGSSTTGATDMEQLTVTNGTNQQWTVNNLGSNVITLANVSSGQLLDVAGDSKSNGAFVDQWPGNGQTNQQWSVTSLGSGNFELTSVNSGLALDVVGGGTTNGTQIDQWTYNGNAWQQWKFTSY